jgi:hypothetical protein
MGDLCDMHDIKRFQRSAAGQAHLAALATSLEGKRIKKVYFRNEVHALLTVLHLEDGSVFESVQPEHDIGVLRETFAEAIETEYFNDFPERR